MGPTPLDVALEMDNNDIALLLLDYSAVLKPVDKNKHPLELRPDIESSEATQSLMRLITAPVTDCLANWVMVRLSQGADCLAEVHCPSLRRPYVALLGRFLSREWDQYPVVRELISLQLQSRPLEIVSFSFSSDDESCYLNLLSMTLAQHGLHPRNVNLIGLDWCSVTGFRWLISLSKNIGKSGAELSYMLMWPALEDRDYTYRICSSEPFWEYRRFFLASDLKKKDGFVCFIRELLKSGADCFYGSPCLFITLFSKACEYAYAPKVIYEFRALAIAQLKDKKVDINSLCRSGKPFPLYISEHPYKYTIRAFVQLIQNGLLPLFPFYTGSSSVTEFVELFRAACQKSHPLQLACFEQVFRSINDVSNVATLPLPKNYFMRCFSSDLNNLLNKE